MKKPSDSKKTPAKKGAVKAKDAGELKKPTKLKPLKDKDKKNWKNKLNDEDEEEDFTVENDIKLDSNFDDEDEDDDGFYNDDY